MKKFGIDEIKKRSEKLPGVGRYEVSPSFGKTGTHNIFGANVGKGREKRALMREMFLPGPGKYQGADRLKIQKKSHKYTFGKANDRFHCQTVKEETAPCPSAYTPKALPAA